VFRNVFIYTHRHTNMKGVAVPLNYLSMKACRKSFIVAGIQYCGRWLGDGGNQRRSKQARFHFCTHLQNV